MYGRTPFGGRAHGLLQRLREAQLYSVASTEWLGMVKGMVTSMARHGQMLLRSPTDAYRLT